MLKRLITSVFILLAVVLFMVLKQFNDFIFDAFVLIIMSGALIEVIQAYEKANKNVNIIICLTPALICAIFNFAENTFKAFGYLVLLAVVLLIYLLTIDIINYAIKRKKNKGEQDQEEINKTLFDETKYTMQVFAYPTLLLSMLIALNHLGFEISYIGIILSFAVAMMTDTFAYVFGRCFGKRKFIPEVSPNKTIAGMIGGFVGGIAACVACYFIFANVSAFSAPILANRGLFIAIFAVIGVLGSWADQLGDLIASALKRKVGVKDYGHIFPGHGGFMDRVDGLMLTASLIFIIFALFLV